MNKIKKLIYMVILAGLTLQPALISQEKVDKKAAPTLFQRIKSSAASYFSQIPSISLSQAKNIFVQKAKCLVSYKKCTPRDRLMINTTWGFALGYGIGSLSLGDKFFKFFKDKVNLEPKKEKKDALEFGQFIMILSSLILAPYSPLWAPSATNFGTLDYDIRNFLTKDPVEMGIFQSNVISERQKVVTGFLGALIGMDGGAILLEPYINMMKAAFLLLREIVSAAWFDPDKTLVSNITTYIKLNYKCIWDVKYCTALYEDPEAQSGLGYWLSDTPERRRESFYYWLGFLAGVAARRVANLTWGRKAYQDREIEKEKMKFFMYQLGRDPKIINLLRKSIRNTDLKKSFLKTVKDNSKLKNTDDAKNFEKLLTEEKYKNLFYKIYPEDLPTKPFEQAPPPKSESYQAPPTSKEDLFITIPKDKYFEHNQEEKTVQQKLNETILEGKAQLSSDKTKFKWYEILGVDQNEKDKYIKILFREWVIKLAPDKNKNLDLYTEVFKAFKEAKEIGLDPIKRNQ